MASGLFLVILGLVVANVKIGGVFSEEFVILVIQPQQVSYAWSLDKINSTVDWALDTLRDTGVLGENNSFKIHTLDSECDNYKTKIKLLDLYYVDFVKPSVVIGPTCPFAVTETSRLASQWLVPVFTAGGTSATLRTASDFQSEYEMLIRMGHTDGKMADAVATFLSDPTVNFTRPEYRLAMVYHSETADIQQRPCVFRMAAIKQRLERLNETTIKVVKDEEYTDRASSDFGAILDEISSVARVVITCTPISDLQEMMRAAKNRGMTDGRFVFIAIDPEFEGMYYGTHLWKTGPVGLWPLNRKNNAKDVSKSYRGRKGDRCIWVGNWNNGTMANTEYAEGPDGVSSVVFTGSPVSKMVIPNNGSILDVRQSLTVLVKINGSVNGNGTIFSYDGSGMELRQQDGKGLSARFVRRDGHFLKQVKKDDVLTPDEWNYIGVSYDYRTGIAKLWHDGKEVAGESIGIVDLRTQGDITVGEQFKGRITCLQVYNYAMDDSQIEAAKDACEDRKDEFVDSCDEEELLEAFRSVLAITLRKPATEEFKDFVKKLEDRGVKENHYVTAYHDSMVLFATALNETIAAGANPADLKENGSLILKNMWNRTFQGAGKDNISIDELGDRDTDYTIVEMDKESGNFKPFWDYMGFTKTLKQVNPNQTMDWPGATPPDPEPCGLRGSNGVPPTEDCPSKSLT
ncbi:uncharacterized protein LOC118405741 isoform X2 [Branchiostoma floridae]|uniref:Uncharacterized protein LOC118405741 isoform X2 n=1 Tax=Branchiostoma floridae TaxID=7739 RepID=A0A9J7HKP2_BRAFL|nr:uncharacterized protein LOC118405741 isoform X2 [Branchiostoma floridae]